MIEQSILDILKNHDITESNTEKLRNYFLNPPNFDPAKVTQKYKKNTKKICKYCNSEYITNRLDSQFCNIKCANSGKFKDKIIQKVNKQIEYNDRIEIFRMILLGNSDFSKDFLDGILEDYCVDNLNITESNNEKK